MKKLYKSASDKKVCGVCGGLGEYLGLDATLIRLVWLFFALFGGVGVLAYIVSALVIPEEPNDTYAPPSSDNFN